MADPYYFEYTGIYSEDEEMERVWAAEEIKDLMSRRAVYNANDDRRGEIEDLWVRKSTNRMTASYGTDFGFYVGMDEIVKYYVIKHQRERKAELDSLRKLYPEVGENALGTGALINHPVSSPFVEIAEDGKTGRGLWYSIGQETKVNNDGKCEGYWMLGKYAADFIREDGVWKIWHIMVSSDLYCHAGEDFGDQPEIFDPGEYMLEKEFGEPTIKQKLRTIEFYWSDDYPTMPKPYVTFDSDNSYGPEGWKYNKGVR